MNDDFVKELQLLQVIQARMQLLAVKSTEPLMMMQIHGQGSAPVIKCRECGAVREELPFKHEDGCEWIMIIRSFEDWIARNL